MIKIISEGIISSIADSLGMGALWGVLKSRFFQFIRGWTALFDIWKADSKEQLDAAVASYDEDINNIKGRYRQAEDEFEKQNPLFGSSFGDGLLFLNPALAMTAAVTEPLMNQAYRQDVRRLMADTGISRWGITPDIVKSYIDDQPDTERVAGRTITTGDDGTVKKTDIILFEPKDTSVKKSQKMEDMIGLFVESRNVVLAEQESRFTKSDAQAMAQKIAQAFEDEGIIAELNKVAEGMIEQKQKIVDDIVTPSAKTIDAISKMMSAETPEEFVAQMQVVSTSNKALKALTPGAFVSEIDNAVSSVKANQQQMADLAKEINQEDISDADLRIIIYKMSRNNFAREIIGILEEVYEKTIDVLMDGITVKGLQKAKETDVGAKYANLVETNIQILENAIKSLDKLEKAGESK